jgi:hypothetical protein
VFFTQNPLVFAVKILIKVTKNFKNVLKIGGLLICFSHRPSQRGLLIGGGLLIWEGLLLWGEVYASEQFSAIISKKYE